MVTCAIFYMARDMSYGDRPSDLYLGTVIIDLAIVAGIAAFACKLVGLY